MPNIQPHIGILPSRDFLTILGKNYGTNIMLPIMDSKCHCMILQECPASQLPNYWNMLSLLILFNSWTISSVWLLNCYPSWLHGLHILLFCHSTWTWADNYEDIKHVPNVHNCRHTELYGTRNIPILLFLHYWNQPDWISSTLSGWKDSWSELLWAYLALAGVEGVCLCMVALQTCHWTVNIS